nr:MAG TPA: hypothetical protein [Caudoviricetes sp.]
MTSRHCRRNSFDDRRLCPLYPGMRRLLLQAT